MVFPLYEKEAVSWQLTEGGELDAETWDRLCREVLNKRVIRRAMFLLEKMDRTELQIRRKLRDNHYPEELIDVAVDYVKSYHYIDDLRYAEVYIRSHQSDKSRAQLRAALQQRGVPSDLIAQAMEEAYEDCEEELIRKLLLQKQYNPEHMDRKQKYRIYQCLLRKGFSNSQIMRQMDLT
ncbi:MAG: RecX family transcriptional regulator [Lachnospiraceae bacterium]|nr:RecX family transcriptional regulator [Lachnospiraceae bacterium]